MGLLSLGCMDNKSCFTVIRRTLLDDGKNECELVLFQEKEWEGGKKLCYRSQAIQEANEEKEMEEKRHSNPNIQPD
ncbi:hypothetical protein NPIL_112631 [Nephila pilipes]|uniref:Uncharacterized protein n=1 Tax=Nephila pilipes TaxID=299642 RepID=A0A8X6MX36_NEPPI|nr:hypothetical protein NPIL_112631 [Nephila pilipes]